MKRIEKLNKQKEILAKVESSATALQNEYIDELETNPLYSLSVDPEDKYKMTQLQKDFIRNYVEFKNVGTAADLAGIDMDTAKQFFISYSSQQEIRRINRALYHRQFSNKLLSIDEIGGYLTSMLTDENVPLGDQLKSSDKLKVVQMLIDLNKLKIEAFDNPTVIMQEDINTEIKNLSVDTIKRLLDTKKQNDLNKREIIDEITENSTPEENDYLSTLPTDQLLQLLEKMKEKTDEHQ